MVGCLVVHESLLEAKTVSSFDVSHLSEVCAQPINSSCEISTNTSTDFVSRANEKENHKEKNLFSFSKRNIRNF